MKKLFCLVLCVLLVFALGAPTFAAGSGPEELVITNNTIQIMPGKNYIISSGEHTVDKLILGGSSSLIIGVYAKVTVTEEFTNKGTIYVLGELVVTGSKQLNTSTIVCCGGTLTGMSSPMHVTVSKATAHKFSNGTCRNCGFSCSHTGIVCPCCGEKADVSRTGSIFSEGSLTVVCTVAAAVVFGFGGFFLGRKKKVKSEN